MNDFNLFVQDKANRGLLHNAWRIAVVLSVFGVIGCFGMMGR